MVVGAHGAVTRVAVLLLGRVGQPLLAEEFHGGLEVAAGGLQRSLAIHDPRSRAVAELLHHGGFRHAHASAWATAISGSAPISAAVPSASSLLRAPRPSRMASATREVMRRTARMASSLPG